MEILYQSLFPIRTYLAFCNGVSIPFRPGTMCRLSWQMMTVLRMLWTLLIFRAVTGRMWRFSLPKEGRGAGYAVIADLARAKGRWLVFADADDFFLPGFLNVLDTYRNTDYDLITFRAETVDSDTLAPVPSRQVHNGKIAEDMDLEILKYRNDVPWAKMVSAELVRRYRIRFDETVAANDAMFAAYVDYHARKVAACSGYVYCVTVRKDSLQYGVRSDTLLARVKVACRYNRFLLDIGRSDKVLYSYSRVTDLPQALRQ